MENNDENNEQSNIPDGFLFIYPLYNEDMINNSSNEEEEEEEGNDAHNHLYDMMMNYMLDQIENSLMNNVMQRSIEEYEISKKENIKMVLEKEIYKTIKINNDMDKECPICKDVYNEDDEVIVLSCKHIIHNECIGEWVKYKPECPLCRAQIPHCEI